MRWAGGVGGRWWWGGEEGGDASIFGVSSRFLGYTGQAAPSATVLYVPVAVGASVCTVQDTCTAAAVVSEVSCCILAIECTCLF